MKKPHLQVTAALIFSEGRVLICRRKAGGRHGGYWEFPGGKQEPGESLEECLVREIKEELDLEIEVGGHFISVDHDWGDFSLTLHAFFCRPLSGTPAAKDGQALAWAEPHDLDRHDLLPADREITRALQSCLGSCR